MAVEKAGRLTTDLFDDALPARAAIAPGALLLRGHALPGEAALLAAVGEVTAHSPFRHSVTPGGRPMSVAMSNCGTAGWVTDRSGYRYAGLDPVTGLPWPAMPQAFVALATDAARQAGFPGFTPDACLINRYEPGARMSLHQDRNEVDFSQPIVSVSLGLPAVFLFGGMTRDARPLRLRLAHGDVLVWGGPARLRFHGVLPVEAGHHPLLGAARINLTFRRAL